uniref:RNase H type-1 domain-containing protein n=1 Tax=Brassica oleracea var. oleracea TaxID=109376 RepID=A0A0D3AYA9_BRAOL
MARAKKQGGLGFKDIATFNDALLAKLSWRILENPSCLLARCLLEKYCKEEHFLSIRASKSSSYGWKGKRAFTPEETLLKAIKEAREWVLSQEHTNQPRSTPTRIAQDPALDPNRTCLYTDAAWNPVTKCAGLAWIIDDAGSSSSHSTTESFVVSPLMAEMLALRNAMNSVLRRGISSILVCSDSQTLINLVNSKGRHLEIASPLNDIYLISPLFNSIKFKFIPRLENSRTDSVAKHTLFMYQT